MSRTDLGMLLPGEHERTLNSKIEETQKVLSAYALRPTPYVMSGTNLGHGAMRLCGYQCFVLRKGLVLLRQDVVVLCVVLRVRVYQEVTTALIDNFNTPKVLLLLQVQTPMLLCCPALLLARCILCPRTCYAKFSTEMAYGSMVLRACYAKSGTEIAYGAARSWSRQPTST
eukprot:1738827-Rhodomonas_salina.4